MALISKIRKNLWIVVVLIALGVLGFIIQDMTSGQQSLFGGSQLTIAKVAGEKVDWNQFSRKFELLYSGATGDGNAQRDALWNYMVEEIIVKKEAEKLGLGVSKTELIDLLYGPNPSPVVRQSFTDPTTGALDRQQLDQIKAGIDNNTLSPEFKIRWAEEENRVIKDRLQTKINTLVSKGIYTPTWMAALGYKDQNEKVSFVYVRAAFDEVDNSDITLEDKDYETFIKENAAKLKQDEETRKIEYVVLDVFPSAADSANIQKVIAERIPEFESTTEDSAFVSRFAGIYDEAYFKKESLSPTIADTVVKLPIGSVYGPYIEGGAYQVLKVLDKKMIPDSVRSRHILIPAQDAFTLAAAQSKVDSLKGLIEAGTHSFDSLASVFGTDATRSKGGDLGYAFPGMMVKEFNDLIFYKAEQGKLYTVVTQFGAHLVEVTGKKFIKNEEGVKIAYLRETIVPSEETQSSVYEKALALAQNNRILDKLREAVKGNTDWALETSPILKKNDYIIGTLGTGQTSRDIIRWAFENNVNEVSPEVYSYQDEIELYVNKYVVVGLKSKQKKGIPAVASIKEDIEQLVINKKKGDFLKAQMKNQDLAALSNMFATQIDTALNVSFATPNLPNVGPEPAVVANALKLDLEQRTPPVVGNTGVYVARIIAKASAPESGDYSLFKNTLGISLRGQVPSRLFLAVRKNMKIKDNRFTFY